MKKIEIIPAINAKSFKEIKNKIVLIEPYSRWLHLDVADGVFTPNITWRNPKDLLKTKLPLKIEVHLMVDSVEKVIDYWLIYPIKRIIFHLEGTKNPDIVINQITKSKKEVGISINPETPVLKLKPFLKRVKFFQILGVNPGKAGQKFQKKVLKKIKWLRKNCKGCVIEGDGGMKVGVVKKMAGAGVNFIASASAVFNKPDIKKAIKELQKDAIF